MDRLFIFKVFIFEFIIDDFVFVFDIKIIKFFKRFNYIVKFYGIGNDIKWDIGDLRWEV